MVHLDICHICLGQYTSAGTVSQRFTIKQVSCVLKRVRIRRRKTLVNSLKSSVQDDRRLRNLLPNKIAVATWNYKFFFKVLYCDPRPVKCDVSNETILYI